LSTAFLDELRARTVLSAVIAPSVKLLRAGREWKACCPFHNEKTPSFTVNDDKGFYHCFGCGAHGDAIRFLTDHRGMQFMDAVKRPLEKLGEDRLIETGMLIRPEEEGKETYDRFRGRLMIPIRDARGRVIAFGGRILREDEPKYLNSPDTPLFDKGRTLYNIDRASPASRSAKRLIVVEGYMDVIALDRAGISEVVAPNGTAVTEAQLERMWRLAPAPILCFDGDSAGRKAAVRAALRALPLIGPERTLRFVELPPGQDPDDVV